MHFVEQMPQVHIKAAIPQQAVEQILLLWAVSELQSHPHQQLLLHRLHPLFLCAYCHKTLETAPVVVYLGLQLGQEVCWPIDNNNVKDLTFQHAWLVRLIIKLMLCHATLILNRSRKNQSPFSSGEMFSWQSSQLVLQKLTTCCPLQTCISTSLLSFHLHKWPRVMQKCM